MALRRARITIVSKGITDPLPIEDSGYEMYDLFRNNPPKGWEKLIELAKDELLKVSTVLKRKEKDEGSYFPLKKDIFRSFHLIPPERVKVVVFGQDPYHQTLRDGNPRATGLAFSQRKDDAVSVSMQNVYRELERTIHGFQIPDHACLEEWVAQGVLLLNTCLTVRPGVAFSHGGIWRPFLTKAIAYLNDINPDVIYVLWGKKAQELIGGVVPNTVTTLEGNHPAAQAPFSFIGCDHFRTINKMLKAKGKEPINWTIS